MKAADFLGGILLGTAIGVTTGLLLAPTSGKQVRSQFKKKSKKYSKEAIQAVRQYLAGNKKEAGEAGGEDNKLSSYTGHEA